jgi:hypothetical protein
MRRFKLRDLIFGPRPKASCRAHFHIANAERRIIVSQAGRDCDANHCPRCREKTSRRVRGRDFLGEHGLDVLSFEARERLLAMTPAKPFKNVPLRALGAGGEISEGYTPETERHGRRHAAGPSATSPDVNPWRAMAGKRALISRHKLRRARQARQRNGFAPRAPEIMARLAVPVAKSMDEP